MICRGLKFRATVKWLCITVGSIGCIGSIVIFFLQKNQQSKEVTKIPPTTTVKSAESKKSVKSLESKGGIDSSDEEGAVSSNGSNTPVKAEQPPPKY